MSKNDCCCTDTNGSAVTVKVDVSKIVKYVCISGVLIVGIIFGTKCFMKMLSDGFIKGN